MKEFTYVITDELGIHARPAGLLVKQVGGFKSAITINAPKGSADARRLMAVMKLSVKKGEEVKVTCEGEDEDAAVKALEEFFKANL